MLHSRTLTIYYELCGVVLVIEVFKEHQSVKSVFSVGQAYKRFQLIAIVIGIFRIFKERFHQLILYY